VLRARAVVEVLRRTARFIRRELSVATAGIAKTKDPSSAHEKLANVLANYSSGKLAKFWPLIGILSRFGQVSEFGMLSFGSIADVSGTLHTGMVGQPCARIVPFDL
jgi:hypothetical protein